MHIVDNAGEVDARTYHAMANTKPSQSNFHRIGRLKFLSRSAFFLHALVNTMVFVSSPVPPTFNPKKKKICKTNF